MATTQDIRAIIALGDSITAGFGLIDHYVIDGIHEYRGMSFTAGGLETAWTMPNLMRVVNGGRKLLGTSEKTGLPWDVLEIRGRHIRPFDPEVNQLNAAQSNARSRHLAEQVDYLLHRLKSYPGLDVAQDWKVLTIFIGANDICDSCNDSKIHSSLDAYDRMVRQQLERIRAAVPRVFVNLIGYFNITQTFDFTKDDKYCVFVHHAIHECDCCFGKTATAATRRVMDDFTFALNERCVWFVNSCIHCR